MPKLSLEELTQKYKAFADESGPLHDKFSVDRVDFSNVCVDGQSGHPFTIGPEHINAAQPSGILAGRRDLVGSALVQMMDMDVSPQTWSPSALIDRDALKGIPHHGIGRGFKVGKEEIAGLLAALERFVERDEDAIAEQFTVRLQAIAAALSEAPSLTARLIARDGVDQHVPLLELTVAGSAHALSRHLQHGMPPVHLGERLAHQNVLTINPQTLRPDDDAVLVRCLIESSRSAV